MTGLDLAWRMDATEDVSLGMGASLFQGNDASGALLAWRGWGLGSRLTSAGEYLPLPPIHALEDDGFFGAQNDDGTRPIGSDPRGPWPGPS